MIWLEFRENIEFFAAGYLSNKWKKEPAAYRPYIFSLPMVGMVVTISPSFNLYKIVVFPAASKPTENVEENTTLDNFCAINGKQRESRLPWHEVGQISRRKKQRDMECILRLRSTLTHKNSHLLFAKESAQEGWNGQTHLLIRPWLTTSSSNSCSHVYYHK